MIEEADTVVVALKSRTVTTTDAVTQSLAALQWLQGHGARQIFFKYCSTFDSTPEGNIGPVADALSDALGAKAVIVCPAFPANGRTVFNGHLFVGRQLLQDSPMKDHPLTPMQSVMQLPATVCIIAWLMPRRRRTCVPLVKLRPHIR
ncbi:four-carbon acid sugar kinase family protein [Brucella sp. BE17]|uniref:four-carbon acid sugar kinase family protein n=1 Tax=Brucella sp. BE17 TaxID=3142977 RepID=UPI0031BA373D